jgi:outer membrane protein assembly factor BamB
VNGNLEPQRGFPLITGLRLSAPPASLGGNLYLCDEDGKVYVVSPRGSISPWETVFAAALRSPPSFLSLPKSGGTYAAVYPKSFLGEIWLLDAAGNGLPGWPALVSGIAFGSPLVFLQDNRVLTAFITQAGELTVLDEKAVPLPPFPLELEGIFFPQPVFDGELLWLVSSDGTLFQISLDGTVLHQQIPGLSVKEEGYITVLDANGDKVPEIFITGDGNALYGYARNFSSLNGFPLPLWGRPFFGDLNGDGKIECIGAGLDNKLYRWQFK